ARVVRDDEVGGSSPLAPTRYGAHREPALHSAHLRIRGGDRLHELLTAGSSGAVPDNLEIELPESGAKLPTGTAESDPENTIVFLVVPGPDGLIR
ncbi:MAG: hypothetical protein ABIO99_08050, partial [Candidatus Limnocylindria bacterium]